jgi:hypothetical protein
MIASDPRPDRPRIFGIGLNKTGTMSFHEAMSILGFESLHWGGPAIRERVEAALDSGRPLLSNLDQRFDAFSDIEVLSRNFELLDTQYQGSRFVLTVRPVDEWIDSRRRHVERNVALKAQGKYDGTFLVVDEHQWRRDWTIHVGEAREYFRGRDDFLEIDFTRCPSWEPLCALLGVTEPSQPFPWANRDAVLHGGAAGETPDRGGAR